MPVAVKTLLKNRAGGKAQEEQHMREIELLTNIDHPNVVKLIAVEEEVSSHSDSILSWGFELKELLLERQLSVCALNFVSYPRGRIGATKMCFLLVMT